MKGVRVNCRTGKVEKVDDGLPFPVMPEIEEWEGVDLREVDDLTKYAKEQGWIKPTKEKR